MKSTLCEKCTNTEFFLFRIQSEYRKIPYMGTFHAVQIQKFVKCFAHIPLKTSITVKTCNAVVRVQLEYQAGIMESIIY